MKHEVRRGLELHYGVFLEGRLGCLKRTAINIHQCGYLTFLAFFHVALFPIGLVLKGTHPPKSILGVIWRVHKDKKHQASKNGIY
jgi:hypothetical protein